MQFTPCSNTCTQDGTHCKGCGRSMEEIAATRALIEAIAAHAVKMGYDNVDEFAQFIAAKASGRVRMLKTQAA